MSRKAIAYALFGFGKSTPANSFEFSSYMRGMFINVRMNRIIYPGWTNVIMVDSATYNSQYNEIFEWLSDNTDTVVHIVPESPLCLAMLWRMMPVFETDSQGWKYDYVLCRDTDSIATYREAQMVQQWLLEDKAIMCITDSVSHNLAMMGGMIGIRPRYFTDDALTGFKTWSQMIDKAAGEFNWSNKGTDQHFLNRYCYPPCATSATEFFIKGMPHNLAEGNGRHYEIVDVEVPGVPKELVCTNDLCGHCGSSGYYENIMLKFIMNIDPYKDDYKPIEIKFPHLFYWHS